MKKQNNSALKDYILAAPPDGVPKLNSWDTEKLAKANFHAMDYYKIPRRMVANCTCNTCNILRWKKSHKKDSVSQVAPAELAIGFGATLMSNTSPDLVEF